MKLIQTLLSRLAAIAERSQSPNESACQVCFFVPEKSKGWILEAAFKEIASRLDGAYCFASNYKKLPTAEVYFFCHYHFYLSALRLNPDLKYKNCFVWFTHPKEPNLGGQDTIDQLQHASVVTMCTSWRNYLIERGLRSEKIHTIVGAADPVFFQSHERGQGKIGFCTAYYERKCPDRIYDTVKLLPELDFVLLGRNWDKYPKFNDMVALNNLEYREAKYSEYPSFYQELDVFVSVSQLEGGPIPLLESMMCNVVPVASDTGFAPDVISDGVNGFLFDADETDCGRIAELIRKAKLLKSEIRSSVLQYSWDAYARKHEDLFQKVRQIAA